VASSPVYPAAKIALLGGTFNPVHLGHLALAQEAHYRFELGRVAFIPAAQNPLKDDPRRYVTDAQRVQMLKQSLESDKRFVLDQRELRRGGQSYTIDTLLQYKDQQPDSELYLLVGADSALTLPKWRNISMYAALCTLVICNRPGYADLSGNLPEKLFELGLRYEYMPLPPIDISSSEIRKRVQLGKPVRYYVPDVVAEYIAQHGLYGAEPA
jgi:nicotinate-nucleotide adenylyltransferase